MATHHGRPGGRLVEVLAGIALALASGVFLVLCIVAPAWILLRLGGGHGGGRSGGKVEVLSLLGGIWLLKYPWNALLKYCRYEAHTLRPLADDETKDRDAR